MTPAFELCTLCIVGFRSRHVFVVLEVGTRRILHWNVTEHPTAEWTAPQFRMAVSIETSHRFVLHDNDSIFAEIVDHTIAAMGLAVLKTPVPSPQANALSERLIGAIRRECLDFLIPVNERQVRRVLAEWVPTTTADVRTRASGQDFRRRQRSGVIGTSDSRRLPRRREVCSWWAGVSPLG